MIRDKMIEEIRRVRHEIAAELGGLDGMFEYFQELDRQRMKKEAERAKRKQKATRRVRSAKAAPTKTKRAAPSPRKRAATRRRGK